MTDYGFVSACASVVLLANSAIFPDTSIASSHIHVCPNALISVMAPEVVDTHQVCEGASDALVFFDRLHLKPSRSLVVEIVPTLPSEVSRTAVGCYLEEDDRILALTFSAFEKGKDWFGVPIDRSMYRSLVTHEVAHAVADCNFAIPDPTIQAKEYVAYVATFAMMDIDLRECILAANPGTGFDDASEINPIRYMFDPMNFGIEAYRHYLKRGRGTAFLLEVLSGESLTGLGYELP